MDWYLLSSTLGQQLYFSVLGWGHAKKGIAAGKKKRKGRKKNPRYFLLSPCCNRPVL